MQDHRSTDMTDTDSQGPRWNTMQWQWLGIAVAGALAAGLGLWGHWIYFQSQGNPGGILDAIYLTFQLFTFKFAGEPGPKPWSLEVARFLAPAVTSYALIWALLRVLGQRWQLWRLKGHVVICGLGRKGVFLAKNHLRSGKRVVIIEADEGNDWIEVCRGLGAVVLNGDAADEDMLRQARVNSASRLIAVCKRDAVNIEIARLAHALVAKGRAHSLGPLQCLIHIVNLKWCASFRSLGVFDGAAAAFAPSTFNFFENSARALFNEHPLDRELIRPEDPRQVHLVVVDCNNMAEALVAQAIRVAHFANIMRPRITVIDPRADMAQARFFAQFPQAMRAADLEFMTGTAQDPAIRQDLVTWAEDCKRMVTVAICTQDETAAMETALTLPAELRERGIPVCVRLADETGIAGVLERARQTLGLYHFGTIPDGCQIGDDLDRQARAFHEVYLAQARHDGKAVGQDAALLPWEELDAGFKDSNRQLADHIGAKLRAIGCVAVPAKDAPGGADFAFTVEEVEILAKMEHARWCADRFMAGWKLGTADKPRKISPFFIPYDQLEEKIKEYDRVAVRNIPKVLWVHAGLGIKRLQ